MSYKMSRKSCIVTEKKKFIGHDRRIIKRPAHLSIYERLGGFWWCKGTNSFRISQTFC